MAKLGLEILLADTKLKKLLANKSIAVVGHPASVTRDLTHVIDALIAHKIKLTCAFGPQHGLRGEKQDNMIESADFLDSKHKIPIFSLYGEVRRPSPAMLEHFDTVLFDLQDVGCRIYTFLTTLFYIMDDCARLKKSVWVLDRPNPAGRPIEGNYLSKGFFSFVGGAEIVMRHGLTLAEAALWYKSHKNLDLDLKIIPMQGYSFKKPGHGYLEQEFSWVNPSPNMPNVHTARMYAGTVLIEGTKISEGRGTTRPLELFGAPDIDGEKLVKAMQKMIPQYLKKGVRLRPCYFEPTFQKHKATLCSGFQIHIDQKDYNHNLFKPYRIICAAFKAVRALYPDYDLWINPPYEYEKENMPIDILSGNSFLREWVDDCGAKWGDLEKYLTKDETRWRIERKPHLIYSGL